MSVPQPDPPPTNSRFQIRPTPPGPPNALISLNYSAGPLAFKKSPKANLIFFFPGL